MCAKWWSWAHFAPSTVHTSMSVRYDWIHLSASIWAATSNRVMFGWNGKYFEVENNVNSTAYWHALVRTPRTSIQSISLTSILTNTFGLSPRIFRFSSIWAERIMGNHCEEYVCRLVKEMHKFNGKEDVCYFTPRSLVLLRAKRSLKLLFRPILCSQQTAERGWTASRKKSHFFFSACARANSATGEIGTMCG